MRPRGYIPRGGESIEETAKNMVALAEIEGELVLANFNGVQLYAHKETKPGQIVEFYNQELEHGKLEYRRTIPVFSLKLLGFTIDVYREGN
jgi:hypothetical protein